MFIIKAICSAMIAIVLVALIVGLIVFSAVMSWVIPIGGMIWIASLIIYDYFNKEDTHTKE